MTKPFLLAAVLSVVIPAAAMAASAGGSGSDAQANSHPPAATKSAVHPMMRSNNKTSPVTADHSADQLNAKELASVQATKP